MPTVPIASPLAPAPPERPLPQPTWLGLRRTALLELLLFFAVAVAVQVLLKDWGLWNVSPHPYWIVVLLLSVQYGVNEGLIAALVSTVALLAVDVPPQHLSEDFYAYLLRLCLKPILWITAALILGGLRTRQVRDREQLRGALADAQQRNVTLAQACQRLEELSHGFETRVAGQVRTVLTTYDAARSLLRRSESGALEGAAEVVRSTMGPERFSLFLRDGNSLRAVVREGWDEARGLTRWIPIRTPLYSAIVEEARILVVTDAADQVVLAEQGVVAGPLRDPDTGEVLGMLKIESISFADLDSETLQIFRIICDWVGVALAHARLVEAAHGPAEGGAVPLHPRFDLDNELAAIVELGRPADLQVASVVVRSRNGHDLAESDLETLRTAFPSAVQTSLGSGGAAFDCGSRDGNFAAIVVAAAYESDVPERLKIALRRRLPNSMRKMNIECRTQELPTHA